MNTEQQLLFMDIMSQAQQRQDSSSSILQRLTSLNNNINGTNNSSSCSTKDNTMMPIEYSYLPRMRIPPLPYSTAGSVSTTSNALPSIDVSDFHFPAGSLEPVPLHPRSERAATDEGVFKILDRALNEVLEDVKEDDDDFLLGQQQVLNNANLTADPILSSASAAPDLFDAFSSNSSSGSILKRNYQETTAGDGSSKRRKKTPTNGIVGDSTTKYPRFRPYQEKQWFEQFKELLAFKEKWGHCSVPHSFQDNLILSRWVKRQRYQYKLKEEGKSSTMTDARIKLLEGVGFVWDSHAVAWDDRFNELQLYLKEHGHCNVPSNYQKNPQLATWVKCQRRQNKLFWSQQESNMTMDRITKLNQIGFRWEIRGPQQAFAGFAAPGI